MPEANPSAAGPSPKASEMRGAIALIAHADRCWKAEEANATRIATKANWVLSVLTAIIGFKLYAIGKEIGEIVRAGFWPGLAFWSLAGLSLFLLLASLLLVLGVIRIRENAWRIALRNPQQASSSHLALDPLLVRNPWEPDEADVAWYIFKVTYNASLDLRAANTRRAAAIDLAQKLLLFGIGFLFASIIVYAWVAYR